MDKTRVRSPRRSIEPRRAWARFVLDASVVCIRRDEDETWIVPDGLTMRQWLRGAGPRPATLADLEYHIGTLVPPVRPRGYLELRMIDAQPGDGWIVPLAVATALLDDPQSAEAAVAAAPRRSVRRQHDWVNAARHGLADPMLAASARACFEIAQRGLERLGAPDPVRRAVSDFTDRYVRLGRCPADDIATDPRAPEFSPA